MSRLRWVSRKLILLLFNIFRLNECVIKWYYDNALCIPIIDNEEDTARMQAWDNMGSVKRYKSWTELAALQFYLYDADHM